jgi:hypothetical protein
MDLGLVDRTSPPEAKIALFRPLFRGRYDVYTRAFLDACRRARLPAALERSRSGRGAHVWLFFEDDRPAQAGVRRHFPSDARATTPTGMPEGDDNNLSSAHVVVDVIPDPG